MFLPVLGGPQSFALAPSRGQPSLRGRRLPVAAEVTRRQHLRFATTQKDRPGLPNGPGPPPQPLANSVATNNLVSRLTPEQLILLPLVDRPKLRDHIVAHS